MDKKLILVLASLAVFLASGKLSGQNSFTLIQNYYQKNGQLNQKDNMNDKAGVIILNEDPSKSLGVTVVNVQQTYKGLRVYNALGKVLIKDNKIVYEKNEFSRNIITVQQKETQEKFSENFLKQKLALKEITTVDYLPNVYFEKNGVYILAKELFVSDKNSSDVWHIIADGETGEILSKRNTVLNCNFDRDPHLKESLKPISKYPEPLPANTADKDMGIFTPANASYTVFPLPVEAPTFGSRATVNNPWDLIASPEGWHSDGTNNYTHTRGNNVYAYSDQDNADIPGYSPDGGSSLSFNFPLAEGRYENPLTYRDAAITNLFYMNNKMHDIFYKFGFTEAARNFQTNNFSNGGIGGDAVRAEAFDGSGFNNANFFPGREQMINGQTFLQAPIMQMFLFERAAPASDPISRYRYNSPASITNRPKVFVRPIFPGFPYGPPETGDLALTVPDNSCTAMAAGSLTGKIALIKNGGCDYDLQVFNAQTAGAIGAIVYNPSSDSIALPTSSSHSYVNQVSIPSLNMGKSEGEFLSNEILAGTTINLTLSDKDYDGYKQSSFDNGIIAHEYGHGISIRLTGDGYSCLNTMISKEQMGEGWSDYFALMLTTRPGDTSSLARGMGTYVLGQPNNGEGIRPAKYSPDFAINNYTYAKTNTVSVPHGVGFIWATMLWDLTWKYIEKYGYNSDVMASSTSGNAKVLQIVMDGLKLQVCNPSFIDGRNAILQADAIGNAGLDKCMIWNVFAKRGLGVNASAGSYSVADDQVEDFTVPQECSGALATEDIMLSDQKLIIFPNPTYDEFFVGNIDKSSKEVKIKMFDMSGKLVFSDSRESGSRKAISTKELQKGVYMVHVQQGDKIQTEKLIVR